MREPLFILCPGRSFSSVVCAVIGQHPEAFGLPEVNLFKEPTVADLIDLDTPVFGTPGATTGLKRAVTELLSGEQSEASVSQAAAWIGERRALTGGQMFGAVAALAPDRMMVDKSPTNSQPNPLSRLIAAFPKASYLHLCRHPRSTGRSTYKALSETGRRDTAIASEMEEHWRRRHEQLMEIGRGLGPSQYMYLKGEWFLEDPKPVLEQICEWLGISRAPEAIAEMMHPERSPFASEGPPTARYGNNLGFIQKPELRIGAPRAENLDDPLDWVDGGATHFSAPTRALAGMLGYGR